MRCGCWRVLLALWVLGAGAAIGQAGSWSATLQPSGSVPAVAGPSWDDVYNDMNGLKSYHVKYDYTGPSGIFKFDYTANDGGAGTVSSQMNITVPSSNDAPNAP